MTAADTSPPTQRSWRQLRPLLPYLRRYRGRVLLGLRSEEHTSELQSPDHFVCRLLLHKTKPMRRPGNPVSSSRTMTVNQSIATRPILEMHRDLQNPPPLSFLLPAQHLS